MEKVENLSKFKSRQKFSALDLRAEASLITSQLSGIKVHNVYDINAKTYILKLTKAGFKLNLLIESGIRMHLINNFPEKNDKPNNFAQKLRKHLRGLFLDSVEQIGVERIVRLKFSGADTANLSFTFYLVVELYAKGNIILLDSQNVILALLRVHTYDEEHKVAPKEVYPLALAAKYYFEHLGPTLEKGIEDSSVKEGEVVTALISKLVPCVHPSIVESFCVKEALPPNSKYVAGMKEKVLKICKALLELYDPKNDLGGKGYLYYAGESQKPFEFSPVKLEFPKKGAKEKEFESFDQALQVFFEQLRGEEDEAAQNERTEKEALKKFNKIREDQERRITAIHDEILLLGKKANAIEINSTEIIALANVR